VKISQKEEVKSGRGKQKEEKTKNLKNRPQENLLYERASGEPQETQ